MWKKNDKQKDSNEEYFQNWYKNFKIKCENDSVERLMNQINKYTIKNIKLKKEIKELKETNVQLFMEYIKENERATKLEEQISLLENKIHNFKKINEFHKKQNGELQQENKRQQLKKKKKEYVNILENVKNTIVVEKNI